MSFKRALTIASTLAALALAAACGSDEQPPVGAPTTSAPTQSQSTTATTTTTTTTDGAAAVIEDATWAQLVERARKCKAKAVKVTPISETKVLTIYVKSAKSPRSISVFPEYGKTTDTWSTGAYYTDPQESGRDLSTRIADDSPKVDSSANPTESEVRTAYAQNFFKELLDEHGCAAS